MDCISDQVEREKTLTLQGGGNKDKNSPSASGLSTCISYHDRGITRSKVFPVGQAARDVVGTVEI